MRGLCTGLAVMAVAGGSLFAHGGTGSGVPPQARFYEETAIRVKAPEGAQFAYGDNLSSYFEGITHRYMRGTAYYGYSDFVSGDAAGWFDRAKAVETAIYPFGTMSSYGSGRADGFSLYSRKLALSVTVTNAQATRLRLLPLITLFKRSIDVAEKDGVVLITPKRTVKGTPGFIALLPDKAWSWREMDDAGEKELAPVVKLRNTVPRLVFETKNAETAFTLTLAFGNTAEEAVAAVKALAAGGRAAHLESVYRFLTRSFLWTDDADYNKAVVWALQSSYVMVVEQFGKGIWAGLPWFRDNWGRDTFIALPGTLLVNGAFEEALAVITNFSTYQNIGELKLDIVYAAAADKMLLRDWLRKHLSPAIIYRDAESRLIVTLPALYQRDEAALAAKRAALDAAFPGLQVRQRLEKGKDYGRIPNRVNQDSIIYNTTDGTPWCIREIHEYLQYTGDVAFARAIWPMVSRALDGAFTNYVDDQGFLTHDEADTWMDAKIAGALPWSARGNRANDIQVLWYNSLRVGAYLARQNGQAALAAAWEKEADKLKTNFLKLFWDASTGLMADRIRKDGSADFKHRPNQLLLITVPLASRLLPPAVEARVVKNAVGKLLYEHGIASLDQDHPYFHPYHDQQSMYHKDAAYHNGTVWGWNAGPAVSGLVRFGYQDFAYRFTKNLAHQILHMGCRGAMSENADAIPRSSGKIRLTGTWSQAWSSSEFVRNAFQDYAGFMPELLEGRVTLAPVTPAAWNAYEAGYAFGTGNASLRVSFRREGTDECYRIHTTGHAKPLAVRFIGTAADRTRHALTVTLPPGKVVEVLLDSKAATFKVDGRSTPAVLWLASYSGEIGEPAFVVPRITQDYPALQKKDYLKQIVEQGEFR